MRIVNGENRQYGYDTYSESLNNINPYEIYFDGLFYQKR
jgi:hypothetical protein